MKRLAMILVSVAACGSSSETKDTSPAGPVGAVMDLRSRITKAEVRARAPADDKATKQEFAIDVHGVKAKIVWRTFEDGNTKYIVSAGWEVVTPSPGVTLESLGQLNAVNTGTEAAPVQSEIVRVRWHTTGSGGTSFGDVSVRIDANGRGSPI